MSPLNSPEQPASPDQPKAWNMPWPLQIVIAGIIVTLMAHPDKVIREVKTLIKNEPAQKAPADPAGKP